MASKKVVSANISKLMGKKTAGGSGKTVRTSTPPAKGKTKSPFGKVQNAKTKVLKGF
jgi:hypothetical protein